MNLVCPRCGSSNLSLRGSTAIRGGKEYYYICKNDSCRNAFRVMQLLDVAELVITDMSPPERRHLHGYQGQRGVFPGCPNCGALGKVKTSWRNRPDGYWRYHKCYNCGPYYTCELNGRITVHRRLKAIDPIDN